MVTRMVSLAGSAYGNFLPDILSPIMAAFCDGDSSKKMTSDDKTPESLDHLVDKLSEEIRDGVDNFTKELADMLAGVDRDLYHLKNRDEANPHEIQAIRKRLKEVSLHFYADHPKISELANDMVVLIKRLGI